MGMTDEELATSPLASGRRARRASCLVSGGGSGIGRAIAYVLTARCAGRDLRPSRGEIDETASIRKHLAKTIMTGR